MVWAGLAAPIPFNKERIEEKISAHKKSSANIIKREALRTSALLEDEAA